MQYRPSVIPPRLHGYNCNRNHLPRLLRRTERSLRTKQMPVSDGAYAGFGRSIRAFRTDHIAVSNGPYGRFERTISSLRTDHAAVADEADAPQPLCYIHLTFRVLPIYLTGAIYIPYGCKLYTLRVQPIYFACATYILSYCNLYTFLLQPIYFPVATYILRNDVEVGVR